jgi:hypothetical protein
MRAGSSGTNPALSANLSFCVFNDLAGVVGAWRAIRRDFAVASDPQVVETDITNGHAAGSGILAAH